MRSGCRPRPAAEADLADVEARAASDALAHSGEVVRLGRGSLLFEHDELLSQTGLVRLLLSEGGGRGGGGDLGLGE